MKIIVCVKQVPDTTEIKLDPVKDTPIRDGVPSIINPDDKGVLKQALLLKDQFGAEMNVIAIGPPQTIATLREAFAMGCDKGYLITDRRFGGADILATGYTISQALKTIDHDIVLAGRQVIDGDTVQVGPQTAEQPDLPRVTYVEHIDCDGKKTSTITHNVEEGHETLEVGTPCMPTLLASTYEPRYMDVPGVMTASGKETITLTANSFPVGEERLGLKGFSTRVKKSFTRGAKAMSTLYEGMIPEGAVDLTIEKLKEKFAI